MLTWLTLGHGKVNAMIYAFDEYELDTECYDLRRNGMPSPLEPQVFAVLLYLIDQRDRVVSKQDLLDFVWPDAFASESALYQRLRAARQAVGDSGHKQQVIKTMHKQGYRFSVRVEEREQIADPTDAAAASAVPQHPTHVAASSDGLPSPETTLPVRQALSAERKLVTVLCGALANAEELADRLGFWDVAQRPFYVKPYLLMF